MKRYLMACNTSMTYYITTKCKPRPGYTFISSNEDKHDFDATIYELRCNGYLPERSYEDK